MRYFCGCGHRVAKCIAAAIIMCGVLGVATMLLWNALVPDLFHGQFVTFWQAVGLLVLAHILFHSPCGHGRWAHHHWKHRFEAKLAAMTPEEREKFKDEYHHHHCCSNDSDKEPDTKK